MCFFWAVDETRWAEMNCWTGQSKVEDGPRMCQTLWLCESEFEKRIREEGWRSGKRKEARRQEEAWIWITKKTSQSTTMESVQKMATPATKRTGDPALP